MWRILAGRPRLVNALHALKVVPAQSGTIAEELSCLARHATQRRTAIEIGTHMGVSAAAIARSIAETGRLYCVDPWQRRRFLENPSWAICDRELRRLGLRQKVVYVRSKSDGAGDSLPPAADFIFVDGDHTSAGLAVDWNLVQQKLEPGGVVCFHDTSVPEAEPLRHPESVDFFEQVILPSRSFELIETAYSMNVLQRVSR